MRRCDFYNYFSFDRRLIKWYSRCRKFTSGIYFSSSLYYESILEGEIILIRIKQNDFTKKRMAHLFAEAFYNDPLYLYMFPNDQTRLEALQLFFKIYLDIYGKYGDIVTTSEDLTAIAYIYYEERLANKLVYYKDLFFNSFKLIDFIRLIGIRDMKRMIKTVQKMSSEWIKDSVEGNYIHLDLIAVQKDCRGVGKAKQLISYAINEARAKNLPLTLETQSLTNTELYKHFNFEIVDEIKHEDIVQYCMIYK